MATSGNTSVSVASGLTLKFNWSQSSQSIANNTTTISWNMQVILASGHTISSSASKDWSVTVNGKTYSGTNSFGSMGSGATKTMASGSTTITHNADGSKQFSYSFSQEFGITFNGSSVGTKSGSGSGTLNTIPRNSSFTLSASTLEMGKTQTVTISSASSSFTHTVEYTFGDTKYTAKTKTSDTKVTFTPSLDMANKIPNATSGTCTVKVIAYSGTTTIGSSTKTFTLTVPSSVKPTVSISPTYNNTLSGFMLAGKSTVKITPTGTGSYNSTIKSYTYSGAGLSGTGSSKTTGTLNTGAYTVTVTVQDSRGRTNTSSVSFTVYAYTTPWITGSAYRCDSAGNPLSNGTYAKAKISWGISNPNSTNVNAKQYKIERKKTTETTWGVYKDWADIGSYSATNYVIDCGSGWIEKTSYDVRISVKDNYSTASINSVLGTTSCIFNVEKSGVGVGKYYERGALDVSGDIYAKSLTCNNNGKNIVVGAGSSDVYIHNSASGKYLQLKDNGTLAYSDSPILMGSTSASGNRWGVWTNIGGDGVMEVGKYLDFHESDGDTSDYTLRITSSGGNLVSSGYISPNNNEKAKFGYSSSDACSYISNANGNWLRLKDDGGLTWRGYNVLHSNGTHAITGSLKTGTYANSFQGVTFKRKTDDIGNYLGKIGCSVIGSTEPTVTIEIGRVSDTSNDSFADGFRRFSFGSSHFLTHTNNAVDIGSSSYRFKAVYATNGTIQTSDGRYKYILEDVDSGVCYELIKDMNLYGYSTLNKRIDEYVSTTEISDELQQSSQEDMNLHMGFIAQEIEDSELAKYILIKDELEDEDGKPTGEHIYSVDNYAYTTAIHGALIHEIELRDKQIESLINRIEDLENKTKGE